MRRLEMFKNYLSCMLVLSVVVLSGCGSGPSENKQTNGVPVITAYSLNGVTGTINQPAKTIAVTMPYDTDVKALVATFATNGTTVTVGTMVQASGSTANDFSDAVTYSVPFAGSTVKYTVTVAVASASAKEITAYSFVGFSGNAGTVNEADKTIVVNLPFGASVASLVANFTTTGKGVTVGAAVQTSGSTANSFAATVTYKVTAADSTFVNYLVTVNVAQSTARDITAFSFAGFPASAGVVSQTLKTIAVTVPRGTDLTNLVANFTNTGAVVKIGPAVQTSGSTPNNFTTPVTYTVNAADGISVNKYVVTVSMGQGPKPVNLGTAGNFVILAKTAVSTTGTTAVVGNIGVSPAAASYITGFGLIADATNTYSTSSLVTGKVYAANYSVPTPSNLTTAVSDMETAFTDAAGRTLPDFTELYAGDITGQTLIPGLYKWGTGVLVSGGGVTLAGGANDVWIFQIGQNLTVSDSAIVTLSGGAQAKNVFWQVSGQANLATAADLKGIILCQTIIDMKSGAKITGRALAQTAVTLIATTVTAP